MNRVTAFFFLILPLCSCSLIPGAMPKSSVEDLVQILYASDPDSTNYSIGSDEYAEFSGALEQLTEMEMGAIDAASLIAKAISFPRRDSYLAAETLLSLGPDIASTTIPILLDNLNSQRPEVREHSIFVLGSIGGPASCAVTEISYFLWDTDPFVRSAAAIAIDSITGEDLVKKSFKFLPGELDILSIPGDDPEGDITNSARIWWEEIGSNINWHPDYGICDP